MEWRQIRNFLDVENRQKVFIGNHIKDKKLIEVKNDHRQGDRTRI